MCEYAILCGTNISMYAYSGLHDINFRSVIAFFAIYTRTNLETLI